MTRVVVPARGCPCHTGPAAGTVFLRGDADGSGTGSDVLTEDKDKSEEQQEKVLRCKVCDLTITSAKEQLSQDGKHQHTFFNPAGIVYEIGCFKNAPGCLSYGPRSSEFSWFEGYSWQVAYCTACLEHLGWHFSTGDNAFFGLVLNRLRGG